MDITTMNYEKLFALRKEIDDLMEIRKKDAADDIRIKMALMGFSPEDFLSKVRKQTKPAACYANPNNPEEIYRGKGKRPQWLQERLDAGQTMDEFKV